MSSRGASRLRRSTFGIEQPHEWVGAYSGFTLKGREAELTNPMLFLFGEDDIRDAAASTKTIVAGLLDFIQALPCDCSIHLFSQRDGASSHCQMGGLSYAHATIFSWLNHVLCGAPAPENGDPAGKQELVDAFGKFGGQQPTDKAGSLLDTIHLI